MSEKPNVSPNIPLNHQNLEDNTTMDQVIENLKQLRNFNHHPGKFWPTFLECATNLAGAETGILLSRKKEPGGWKNLHIWPVKNKTKLQSQDLRVLIGQVAENAVAKGHAWETAAAIEDEKTKNLVLAVRLEQNGSERVNVAVFLMKDSTADKAVASLRLITDTPAVYQRIREAQQVITDTKQFAETMDLLLLLNEEKSFVAAAMTFVNEIASRYKCSRTSLGWLQGDYIRLQTISHMERFEKKMDIVKSLEAAMEEALDQNEEIFWPPPPNGTAIIRDHELFVREENIKSILSIPIRLDNLPIGVLTCEREIEPFSENEIKGLRVLCDLTSRRLGDLKENDRWFFTQVAIAARKGLSRLFGVEHTLAKAFGILTCGVVLFLMFGKLPYRIETPFILKSDSVRYLPAPFDGYIDKVQVDVGEQVEENDLLLTLDTEDLLLEESAGIANQIKFLREAEKARATNALAEMKIAQALAEQAKAQLQRIRYHLNQAEVKSAFSGIVVEGDLKELQGAPVKKGDILFKVARIENMYAELDLKEQDIHEVAKGMEGQLAFVSQPQLKFPFKIERIDPVAVAKENGNVFQVRCQPFEKEQEWWRPGMSGVAKINAGRRNALWLLTHRTADYFQMLLWW